MTRKIWLVRWMVLSLLPVAGCGTTAEPESRRDDELAVLTAEAGAPVTMEVDEAGVTRVLRMAPQSSVPVRAGDPAAAALAFVAAHHDVFGLDDDARFAVTRVDVERRMTHVTLQRTFAGVPVFQGAITVHLDDAGVIAALGDEHYRIAPPRNAPVTADAELRIFEIGPGDSRYAYQARVTWLDGNREQHDDLVLRDAEDGRELARYSLVNTFTGRVFSAAAQPTAGMMTDTRTVVGFDGDPTASPSGWVGSARTTSGNNAVAATDIDANNTVGTTETVPVANASDSFDFAFDPTQDAAGYRSAAVTSAFYLVNDFHDRTYALGFTEAAGNFQAANFGKGGAQNDPVTVDAQDGSGTNNANFATPPDGSKPRMQLFLFTQNGGASEDADFDPTVVYHEASHGLSNRLVGGGSTACLGGVQSGGMGEGWGDLMAASFLDNPVIGAYVTGNATTGVRRVSMAASPFTYDDIKTRNLSEAHDIGELWAAVLWDIRKVIGATTLEQLVVAGMKLTPCNPTMLQARDAILQADATLTGGANRCTIWHAFAARKMGTAAVSPNHNSTTSITTSNTVPVDCATLVFSDNFEVDRGWRVDPAGIDTATGGRWQRADPQQTTNGGPIQLGTTPSGNFDLVTGATAGATVDANDIDGGVTTVRSPPITLPATGATTLTFKSYFAHANNSSFVDQFQVRIVSGTTATTVYAESGSPTQVNGLFASHTVDISAFDGQTIYLLISASDSAPASLVEAAVDDVSITNQ